MPLSIGKRRAQTKIAVYAYMYKTFLYEREMTVTLARFNKLQKCG